MNKKLRLKPEVKKGLILGGIILVLLLVIFIGTKFLSGNSGGDSGVVEQPVVDVQNTPDNPATNDNNKPNDTNVNGNQSSTAGYNTFAPVAAADRANFFKKNQERIYRDYNHNAPWRDLTQYSVSQLGNVKKGNTNEQVGFFYIPSIGVGLNLYGVMNDNNTIAGVSTMGTNFTMGKGNYVVTGHSARTFTSKNLLLTKLQDVKKGDKIVVTNDSNIYVYQTIDTRKTGDDAIYMVEESRVKDLGVGPLVTIMTCYNGKASLGRWFVTGKLVETIPYSEAKLNELIK